MGFPKRGTGRPANGARHSVFLGVHTGQKSEEKPGYWLTVTVTTTYFFGGFLYAKDLSTQDNFYEVGITVARYVCSVIATLQIRKRRLRD